MYARLVGESWVAYTKRRRAQNIDFASRMLPRLSRPACQLVSIPPKGEDPKTDDAILQGKIRQVSVIDAAGNRVGRTKGVPYRRYHAAPGSKRSLRRLWERSANRMLPVEGA